MHINQVFSKTNIRVNLIFKFFVSKDELVRMRTFTVYARPVLEYAACVLLPYHASKIAQVERTQRSFNQEAAWPRRFEL